MSIIITITITTIMFFSAFPRGSWESSFPVYTSLVLRGRRKEDPDTKVVWEKSRSDFFWRRPSRYHVRPGSTSVQDGRTDGRTDGWEIGRTDGKSAKILTCHFKKQKTKKTTLFEELRQTSQDSFHLPPHFGTNPRTIGLIRSKVACQHFRFLSF